MYYTHKTRSQIKVTLRARKALCPQIFLSERQGAAGSFCFRIGCSLLRLKVAPCLIFTDCETMKSAWHLGGPPPHPRGSLSLLPNPHVRTTITIIIHYTYSGHRGEGIPSLICWNRLKTSSPLWLMSLPISLDYFYASFCSDYKNNTYTLENILKTQSYQKELEEINNYY